MARAIATFDHELLTDEGEVVLVLTKIFFGCRRAGDGRMRTLQPHSRGVLGRGGGMGGGHDPSLLVGGLQVDAPSFAVRRSAATILGALCDALDAGVTVTAEYEGVRVG